MIALLRPMDVALGVVSAQRGQAWESRIVMLSRSYRRAAANERREARRAVECDVTGNQTVDDAALGWRVATTTVLLLIAVGVFAVGGYEVAGHSARSVPLFVAGLLLLAAAIRSGVKLAMLWQRRRMI